MVSTAEGFIIPERGITRVYMCVQDETSNIRGRRRIRRRDVYGRFIAGDLY